MPIDCVVLDLDGTLTDLRREAPAFTSAFPALVADLLGRDLGGLWAEAEAVVHARSPELGWMIEGHAVAPADADPYILASTTAHVLFDELGVLRRDAGLRGEVISAIFRRAYRETTAAFRPEAPAVLAALLARVPNVYVVTNAEASVAITKLATLAHDARDARDEHAPLDVTRLHVRGDAGKYLIGPPAQPDARFEAAARPQHVSGLARPILRARGRYFDALAAIWGATGSTPERTLVCGDIYEMDLALPAALGASVHLVRRPRTFAYEVDAVAALGTRGATSEGLRAVLERV